MQRDVRFVRAAACRRTVLSALAGVLLVVAGWPRSISAQPPERQTGSHEPVVVIGAERSSVTIVERFSKVIRFQPRIVRVDGFDPEVIDVTALSPRELRVQALSPGVTTMVVTDENGDLFTVEVFVAGDVRHLQAYIDRLFPKAAVEAVAIRDTVVLRGWVTKPEEITELVQLAEQFYGNVLNQMKVGGVQQVLLKVKVIEVQRTKIRQLGLNFIFEGVDTVIASTPGMLTPLAAFATVAGTNPTASVNTGSLSDPTIALGIVNDGKVFEGFIEALREESLLKILSEPEVVTTNGRPATFLSGGEFPVLVPQGLGTISIEWREFGTRLEVVPIILGHDRVRLELQPEVSDRDFSNAVNVQGSVVPGLTTRRVNTQVELLFGQTLMIAGLLSNRETAVLDKIPFLGELPLIGAAFRRERYDETETELVIMVTPELVAPLERHEVLPGGPGLSTETPNDREFFLYGFPEVPNYGDGCAGCESPYGGQGAAGPIEPIPAGDAAFDALLIRPQPTPADTPPPSAPSASSADAFLPPVPAQQAAPQLPDGAGATAPGDEIPEFPAPGTEGTPGEPVGLGSEAARRRQPAYRQVGFSRLEAPSGRNAAGEDFRSRSGLRRPQLIEPSPGLIQPAAGEN